MRGPLGGANAALVKDNDGRSVIVVGAVVEGEEDDDSPSVALSLGIDNDHVVYHLPVKSIQSQTLPPMPPKKWCLGSSKGSSLLANECFG